jgi:hypothetical protein
MEVAYYGAVPYERTGFSSRKRSSGNIDLTAETPKLEDLGLNIKVLCGDFLEKRTFRSEINIL